MGAMGDGHFARRVANASSLQRMMAAGVASAGADVGGVEECFAVEIPEGGDDDGDDSGASRCTGTLGNDVGEAAGGPMLASAGGGKLTRAQRIAAKKAAQAAMAAKVDGGHGGTAAAGEGGVPPAKAAKSGASAQLMMVKELKEVLGVKYSHTRP
eukprot:jgi/Mesvir1/11660/Mv00057-RA.1